MVMSESFSQVMCMDKRYKNFIVIHIFLHCRVIWKEWGNSLLEAMSYGNCCLISDIPENTEVVHEKAMWFEKGNAMDLQKKLQMLLDDSELVKKYKTEAAPYILERYSWDIVVDQMLRVYAGDVVDYDTVLRERECSSGEKA